jgi:hypothetical protein
MKKLLLLFVLCVGTLSFGQTKTKDIDKDVNQLLDSLSKVYRVKVTSVKVVNLLDVRTTSITYVKNNKKYEKVIKKEKSSNKSHILSEIIN